MTEESRHIIKLLAQRRGITTKKLLSTIKQNKPYLIIKKLGTLFII